MRPSIHVVCHTHWDREWYLPFEEFRLKLVRLVDSLLDILETEPSYPFFMLDGQTIVLDDYLELRPENAGRLRKLVREGRLLVGPWYVLPDEALVGGESLVRNLERGLRRAAGLGGAMPVGYVPDQFGHSADLPTVLRGFGLTDACLWRGVGEEVGTQAFCWRSPSGAEVFVAYLATSYSNAAGLSEDPGEVRAQVEQAMDALRPFAVVPVYLLMNGTDHQFLRRGAGRALAEVDRELRGAGAEQDAPGGEANRDPRGAEAGPAAAPAAAPAAVRISTLPAYLADLRRALGGDGGPAARLASLPVVEGELRSGRRAPVLPGTLSARIRQKQRNRRLEDLLTRWAEPAAVMAWLLGQARYPAAELDYAWGLLLQNHPHDSICGCSLDVVHREIETRFDKAEQVAAGVLADSLDRLRGYLSPGPGVVTVVNTGLTAEDGLVEAAVPDEEDPPVEAAVPGEEDPPTGGPGAPVGSGGPEGFGLVGPDGEEVAVQEISAGAEDVLFTQTVTPLQLRTLLPFVAGREVMGVFVNGLTLARPSPGLVRLELVVGDRPVGEFDWKAAKDEVRRLLGDRSVNRFHVIARRSAQRRVIFLATGVPGLGWKQYRVGGRHAGLSAGSRSASSFSAARPTVGARVAGPARLENGLLSVTVNPDGTLDVTDAKSGLTARGLGRLVDGGDRGDLYDYCPPERDRLVDRPVRPVKIKVVEAGPVRASIEVTAVYVLPRGLTADRRGRRGRGLGGRRDLVRMPVTTQVSLVAGERLVCLRVSFDNQAEDHRLQAVFPTPEPFDTHYALGQFSVVERPAREPVGDPAAWSEPPSGTWPNLGFFGGGGLTVFTRGLPEYAVLGAPEEPGKGRWKVAGQPTGRGEALALTLVRSVGWLSRDDLPTRPGHAGPGVATPEGQSQGRHVLEFAVSVHGGDWRSAGVVGLHLSYSADLLALPDVVPPLAGQNGPDSLTLSRRGLLEFTPAAPPVVVATAVKAVGQSPRDEGSDVEETCGQEPDHGQALVVRLVNLSAEEARAELRAAGETGLSAPVVADLAGRPLEGAGDGERRDPLALGPWEVLTLRFNRPGSSSETRRLAPG